MDRREFDLCRIAKSYSTSTTITSTTSAGVFGVCGSREAANLTYLGLHALQHRGQESAGIASSRRRPADRAPRARPRARRLQPSRPRDACRATSAIGHVRYSTAGEIARQERAAARRRLRARLARRRAQRQPHERRRAPRAAGGAAAPSSSRTSDTEVIVHLIARSRAAHRGRPRGRRAAPGAGRVLAAVPHADAADRRARSVRLPAALHGPAQGRQRLGVRLASRRRSI